MLCCDWFLPNNISCDNFANRRRTYNDWLWYSQTVALSSLIVVCAWRFQWIIYVVRNFRPDISVTFNPQLEPIFLSCCYEFKNRIKLLIKHFVAVVLGTWNRDGDMEDISVEPVWSSHPVLSGRLTESRNFSLKYYNFHLYKAVVVTFDWVPTSCL